VFLIRTNFFRASRGTKLIYFHMNRTGPGQRGGRWRGVAGTDPPEPNWTERNGMEPKRSGLNAMSIYITPRSDFLCHLVVIVSVVCYLLVCVLVFGRVSRVCIRICGILHVLCHIAPFAWKSVSIGELVCVSVPRVRLQFDLS